MSFTIKIERLHEFSFLKVIFVNRNIYVISLFSKGAIERSIARENW